MIDTSKYTWTDKNSENDKEILTQNFYDNNAHVRYCRMAWNTDMSKEDVDVLRNLFISTFKLTESILPNCIKYEISDSSVEVILFEDDDTVFRTKTELEPKIREILGEKLSVTYKDLEEGFTSFNKKLEIAIANDEVRSLAEDIYSKYLDKEL